MLEAVGHRFTGADSSLAEVSPPDSLQNGNLLSSEKAVQDLISAPALSDGALLTSHFMLSVCWAGTSVAI